MYNYFKAILKKLKYINRTSQGFSLKKLELLIVCGSDVQTS